jgi:hypothetical protein
MVILSNLGLVEDCASPNRLLNSQSNFVRSSNERLLDKLPLDSENPANTDESSGSDPSETKSMIVEEEPQDWPRNAKSLSWMNFTVDFKSSVGAKQQRFTDLERVCTPFEQKFIDLRPYMEPKPFTCFRKDSYQKTLSIFRLMNCRQMPVLDEKRNCSLVGIITRQDLFKYMWITD